MVERALNMINGPNQPFRDFHATAGLLIQA